MEGITPLGARGHTRYDRDTVQLHRNKLIELGLSQIEDKEEREIERDKIERR